MSSKYGGNIISLFFKEQVGVHSLAPNNKVHPLMVLQPNQQYKDMELFSQFQTKVQIINDIPKQKFIYLLSWQIILT